MLAGVLGTTACQHAPQPVPPGVNIVVPSMQVVTPVEVWLTTADQKSLLARQHNTAIFYNATPGRVVQVIEINEDSTYQSMIGFGAAMTDASAQLIQNHMSAQ